MIVLTGVLAMLVILLSGDYLQQSVESKACTQLGAVDAPIRIGTEQPVVDIQGWAIDHRGIRRIEAVANGKVLTSTRDFVSRPDVTAAYPNCGTKQMPGFSLSASIGNLPPKTRNLQVRAVTDAEKSFALGSIPVDLSKPFGQLDSSGPIRWNAENVLSGWAISGTGSPLVRVMAEKETLATVKAEHPRQDVAKVFPAWPGAVKSGFDVSLSMRDLPRGRYRLRLSIADAAGGKVEFLGPEVINDLPIGKVVASEDRLIDPAHIPLTAWLADEDGIASATVETESEGSPVGAMELRRRDAPLNSFQDPHDRKKVSNESRLQRGTVFGAILPDTSVPPGLHRLVVRVKDKKGKEAILPGPLVLMKSAEEPIACPGEKLRLFYPGTASVFREGFIQMEQLKAMVGSGCVEVGIRGRVEYLRTTLGKDADYRFDPDFSERLRDRGGREMTTESLRELLSLALRHKAPLLVTLDGGVWADSKFPAPDLDVVDFLEQDESAVQWNQHGRTEPDDALSKLPGSVESPQLARMMSLNRYNRKFLDYKKRNLQAAVAELVRFSRRHPETFVAVALDPDEYINPWFYLTQWYDYNPNTLRQYREWLFHLGPYADGGPLANSRREPKLTLDEANRLGEAAWNDISQVEPPRGPIDYRNTWQQLWTQFKRRLVAQHYQDLANWIVEAGLPASRIYTAQTFIQADVAVKTTDRATGWTDQAGVSIEGAKPANGHIGAIFYGPASRDEGKSRSGLSLIDNIRRADPYWGVCEFHPATISFPDRLPNHEESYATLLTLIDGGARFLSPMWGSFARDQVVHPSAFRAYDSMEGTPFEYQLVWWMRAMRAMPAGSLLYPFGNALVASGDGWKPLPGTDMQKEEGSLRLTGGPEIALRSPPLYVAGEGKEARLEISGSWPAHSTIRARLEFEAAKAQQHLLSAGGGTARLSFPPPAGRRLTGITLYWRGTQAEPVQAVALDQVSLVVLP
jgi:hypothetical protein